MIYITGDTLLGNFYQRFNKTKLSHLNKGDYLIIAGDRGLGSGEAYEATYKLEWFSEQSYTILVLLAEPDEYIAQLPVCEWSGGKAAFLSHNVICLLRAQIYDIEGLKIFSYGSINSYGKLFTMEELSVKDEMEGIRTLRNMGRKVDLVLSSYPYSACLTKELKGDEGFAAWYLQEIKKGITFRKWYMGYNPEVVKSNDDKSVVLSEEILRIDVRRSCK